MANEYNWNQQNARANAFGNNFDNFWPNVEDREPYKNYSDESLQALKETDPVFKEILRVRDIINTWMEGFNDRV